MTILFYDFHDFFSSDWDLATDGVFGGNHIFAQAIQHGLVAALWQLARQQATILEQGAAQLAHLFA